MSARDDILAAIRAAAVPPAPPAQLPSASTHESVESLRSRFLEMLETVGGQGMVHSAGQPLERLLTELLGDNRAEAMIIRGKFAVAENGAVYVDAADLGARNDVVRAEHLVVIVPVDAVVPTMHEAMRLIPPESTCGWFLSGPSKTADIEQALVVGAQGSRTHRVVFGRD